jgi:hypothetical protein
LIKDEVKEARILVEWVQSAVLTKSSSGVAKLARLRKMFVNVKKIVWEQGLRRTFTPEKVYYFY